MTMNGKMNYRYNLVKFALANGNKQAAKEYRTSAYIVRKWRLRYQEGGLRALIDNSRRPHTSPNKCPEDFENKVLNLRLATKHRLGSKRLIDRYDLEYGKNCVQRIINEFGLKRKPKKKREKRNELWCVKKLTKLFEKIQVDVKVLTDIPQYWNVYKRKALPTYEFTARDVKTGATFVCYARKNNSANAATFLCYLMDHLTEHGFKMQDILFQMDNGAEFFACGKRKKGKTPVENVIEDIFGSNVGRIPPASPTFNSDVETFHRLVEYEFYDLEDIENEDDLQAKMNTFLLDFNYLRQNSYKDYKTPISLAREDYAHIPYTTFSLFPIILDDNQHLYFNRKLKNRGLSEKDQKLFPNGLPNALASLKEVYPWFSDYSDFTIKAPTFSNMGGNDLSSLDKKPKKRMFKTQKKWAYNIP